MTTSIRISAGEVSVEAELNDSATAAAVLEALPIEASGNRWGDEIYFSIPVDQSLAPDARAEMELGELAYWPPGHAFCIFFGPTPASNGDAPQAASPVNPIGRIVDDVEPLKNVPDGMTIRVIDVGVEPEQGVRRDALAEASEIARRGRANTAAQGVSTQEADAVIEEAIGHVRRRNS